MCVKEACERLWKKTCKPNRVLTNRVLSNRVLSKRISNETNLCCRIELCAISTIKSTVEFTKAYVKPEVSRRTKRN